MTWVLVALGAGAIGWFLRGAIGRAPRPGAERGGLVPEPAMLESALAATPIGIGYADRELRFVRVNETLARFSGRPVEDHVGRPVSEMLSPEDAAAVEPLLRRVLESGEPVLGIEVHTGTPDGPEPLRHFVANLFPVRDPQGHPYWVGATVIDITVQQQAQEEREQLLAALRESEARFRALADSGVIGVLVADPERVIEANDAFLRLIGYSRDEMLAGEIRWTEITPPEYAALDQRAIAQLLDTGVCPPFEKEYIRKDGARVPIVIGAAITEHSPLEWACFVIDTSKRKRAEEDVQKFVSLVESSGDFIAMVTLDWRLFYLNKAGRRLVGLPEDAPVDDIAIQALWHEGSRQLLEAEVFPRLASGQSWNFDGQLRNPRTGDPIEIECSAFGIRDAQSGRVLAGAFVLRDLTERRRVEEHLRQAQRMEAIGRVAGGVAHEVNNMMTVIQGFCAFLARSLEPHDPRNQDVAQIIRAAERSADVSRQLLAYSRRQLLQPRVLELNTVLLDMESVLRRLMGEDHEFVFRLAPELGWIKTDRTQLEQVIINLTLNARDAMPQGGQFTIATSTVVLGSDYAQQHPGIVVRPGPYVVAAISDTGRGMDSATQAQIFEPFFTTKPVGHGTGLGLSMAYGIVKQSGGYIWAYSEPGQGTTFKVYLPQVEESGERVSWAAPPTLPRGAGETILVVEDEDMIRDFACRFLEGEGYRSLPSANAREAIEWLRRAPGAVDLVLSDVVMPGMGGREFADQVGDMAPDLPVIFMSGYTNDDIIRRGLLSPGTPFLQKPFSPETLARKVREVLNQTGRRSAGPA